VSLDEQARAEVVEEPVAAHDRVMTHDEDVATRMARPRGAAANKPRRKFGSSWQAR